ncbi:metalloregulator ArsR/SmtB family transcription factor, partial [Acinetobacter baumannii]
MAANDKEVCVCELVDSLEVPQYHVSRHWKELRNARLLRARRDGRWVYYSLDLTDPVVKELAEVVRRLPADLFRE